MVPAGMADVDVVRAGVLREHVARQDAEIPTAIVAVALAVALGDLERRRPAGVGEQLVRGIVEIVVARHLAAVGCQPDASASCVQFAAEQPPPLFEQISIGFLIERHALHRRVRIDIDHGESRRQETGGERARTAPLSRLNDM